MAVLTGLGPNYTGTTPPDNQFIVHVGTGDVPFSGGVAVLDVVNGPLSVTGGGLLSWELRCSYESQAGAVVSAGEVSEQELAANGGLFSVAFPPRWSEACSLFAHPQPHIAIWWDAIDAAGLLRPTTHIQLRKSGIGARADVVGVPSGGVPDELLPGGLPPVPDPGGLIPGDAVNELSPYPFELWNVVSGEQCLIGTGCPLYVPLAGDEDWGQWSTFQVRHPSFGPDTRVQLFFGAATCMVWGRPVAPRTVEFDLDVRGRQECADGGYPVPSAAWGNPAVPLTIWPNGALPRTFTQVSTYPGLVFDNTGMDPYCLCPDPVWM